MEADTVIAVCATVIALGSLWTSYSQARTARFHNRQSVRPLLQIRQVKNYEDQKAGLQVINVGLGPAVITKTVVTLDGELIGQWNLQTYRTVTAPLSTTPKMFALFDGVSFIAGQSAFLLHLDEFNPAEHDAFWELIAQRLRIEIHYESLYGGEDFRAVPPPI
ncbi:hypothetical protein ACFXOS_07070 [Streptomyces sp. NPDC059175]|uniref:hypothetical protein n=1 Tax=Streptomyces sp. NPDC059175 TaxID=3346757 RepID=UPI0036A815A3